MSLGLMWSPVNPGQRVQGTGLDSEVCKVIQDTFGAGYQRDSDITILKECHIFALRGMARSSGDTMYGTLADLIEEHGDIEVWGEH